MHSTQGHQHTTSLSSALEAAQTSAVASQNTLLVIMNVKRLFVFAWRQTLPAHAASLCSVSPSLVPVARFQNASSRPSLHPCTHQAYNTSLPTVFNAHRHGFLSVFATTFLRDLFDRNFSTGHRRSMSQRSTDSTPLPITHFSLQTTCVTTARRWHCTAHNSTPREGVTHEEGDSHEHS